MLNYIASKKQIKTCKKPEHFLHSYKNYLTSPKILFYVKDLLSFFEILSRNEEFELNEKFLKRLLSLLFSFPNKDVLHYSVFKILENQIKVINSSPPFLAVVGEFLLQCSKLLKAPLESKGKINPVSLHFISGLLKVIEIDSFKDKTLREKVLQ